MSKDVECPYCGKEQEINHDDGYGYEEDGVFQQECPYCDKIFVFTTSISFYYDVEKAPCLNGSEHDWRPITGWPKEHFIGKEMCQCCGEERQI